MKRFHVHVAVDNLAESIAFYSALFGCSPSVAHPDYAKWQIDDPRINFAISTRGAAVGVDHLGIQVDSDAELAELHERLQQATSDIVSQQGTACCYAESDKHWVRDPSGIAWESYHTLATVPTFNRGEADRGESTSGDSSCCAPAKPRIKLADIGVCTSGSGCC